MTGKTHVAGGMVAGEIAALTLCGIDYATAPAMVLLVTTACLGALAPDIDNNRSTITNTGGFTTKAFSKFLRLFVSHRGFLHTPFFIAIFALVVTKAVSNIPSEYALFAVKGFVFGYISHLCLDLLNPEGLILFFPIYNFRISIGDIKTGSAGDRRAKKFLAGVALFLFGALLLGYGISGGKVLVTAVKTLFGAQTKTLPSLFL